jgi:hypothetical protein
VTDELNEPYGGDEQLRGIADKAMELCVTIGLFDTVQEHWPETVQENWRERKEHIRHLLQLEINEVLQFAEAYDQ